MPRIYKPAKPSNNKAVSPAKETKTAAKTADRDKKEESGK